MSSPPSGPDYSWQSQHKDYKSAPTYGQPPRQSRAGLIIALIVVFALVGIGAAGILVYRLVSDHLNTTSGTATPATEVAPAAAATQRARQFVAQLNANKSAAAVALSCEDSRQMIPNLIQAVTAPPTRLTLGAPYYQADVIVFPLTGTTKGSTVTGTLVLHQRAPEGLCVSEFQLTAR
ncbi:hypothetical protein [Kribbella sp. NPDC049584]|uniref:hypothetical protein n=1 Tax=Kribbella sp. NPDC049584 TaxID=3154833 RepID=UPI00343A54F7